MCVASWSWRASSSGSPAGRAATPPWRRRSTTSASMTGRGRSPLGPTIDLDDLGFDRGAHLLVERALAGLTPGATLGVRVRHPRLGVNLPASALAHGHTLTEGAGAGAVFRFRRGSADDDRW